MSATAVSAQTFLRHRCFHTRTATNTHPQEQQSGKRAVRSSPSRGVCCCTSSGLRGAHKPPLVPPSAAAAALTQLQEAATNCGAARPRSLRFSVRQRDQGQRVGAEGFKARWSQRRRAHANAAPPPRASFFTRAMSVFAKAIRILTLSRPLPLVSRLCLLFFFPSLTFNKSKSCQGSFKNDDRSQQRTERVRMVRWRRRGRRRRRRSENSPEGGACLCERMCVYNGGN